MSQKTAISPISDIIEDARNGRMFILIDHHNRENEGDVIIPADAANADSINFMAKYARGLVCLALSGQQIDRLHLPFMAQNNQSRHETAFTVSIEARTGISTGISAHDRAHTIQVAINKATMAHDIVSPGHVFPLRARDGGVLIRAGHTEAAVDISRLAGRNPSGVICEVMKDDGTMARLDDLIIFAKEHGLKIGTIEDLIAYRHVNDHLIQHYTSKTIQSPNKQDWVLHIYNDTIYKNTHLALTYKGNNHEAKTPMVRMHQRNVFHDLAILNNEKSQILAQSMAKIEQHGNGALVLLDPTENSIIQQYEAIQAPENTHPTKLRQYGIGAQILKELHITNMILITSTPKKVIGLSAYDITIENTVKL